MKNCFEHPLINRPVRVADKPVNVKRFKVKTMKNKSKNPLALDIRLIFTAHF